MTDHPYALDEIDTEILGALKDVHSRIDPTPPGLTERVTFALTVRALHAEVAQLIETPVALLRGVDAQKTETITFAHGALSLMVNIGAGDGSHARIDGWVTSGGAEVEVVTQSGTMTAVADANGRFVLEAVPRGPVYFVIRTTASGGTARPVVTPTIEF